MVGGRPGRDVLVMNAKNVGAFQCDYWRPTDVR